MAKNSEINWMVFDRFNHDIFVSETAEGARDIAENILTRYTSDPEGIPEEVMNGGIMVAKVVAQSYFKVTDRQTDYDDPEAWPYSDSFDLVGDLYMHEKGGGE